MELFAYDVGELVGRIPFCFYVKTFTFTADLPVLAVDAMQVAIREEDVDDGIEGRLLASVDAYGRYFEGVGSAAEAGR